ARVVVAPSAEVRHLEATASRRRPCPEARALQWRHELRAVLKNYGRLRRWTAVAQLAVLSVAEVIYFLLVGKRRRVHQVVGAWRWNFAPERQLRLARAEVASARRLPDRVVARLLSRRTSRLIRYLLPHARESMHAWGRSRPSLAAAMSTERVARRRDRRPRWVLSLALLVALILVVGSRSVLADPTPLVGQFLPIQSPATMLGHFLGGWQDAGLQGPGPASPAFAFLGLAGGVLFGATGLLLVVELVVWVALGAFGMARLLRPLAPPAARLVGVVAYLFLPLAWNDIARGQLQALVAFAAMPWVISRLARAGATGAFARREGAGQSIALECLSLGVLLALFGSFVPLVVLVALACALCLAIGGLFTGDARSGLRMLAVGAGGALVAFVLCLPWAVTFVQPGARWSVLLGAESNPSTSPSLSELLRFGMGPTGHGLLGWALLAAAGLVLLIGQGERLAWGARLWCGALGTFAFAWAADQGWLGSGGGSLQVLLAPAAAFVAAAVGLGAAAVGADLRLARFGWRHVAVAAFGCCAVAGLLPVLGATASGRWGLPSTGYDAVLSFTGRPGGPNPQARSRAEVLWLGDPAALPLPGWQLSPGLAMAVSPGGLPTAGRLWLSANPGRANALAKAVVASESGQTVTLGRLVAEEGVREIIVPRSMAPVLGPLQQSPAAPPPGRLLVALAAQGDLHQLPSEGGALVFENTDWSPTAQAATRPVAGGTPAVLRTLGMVAEVLLWVGVLIALGARRRSRRHRLPAHGTHRHHSFEPAVAPSDGAGDNGEPAVLESVGQGGAS
ncbi:MAG: putative glycosyltransferase, partial [Acidimicrobiaceae bacterium]|nr:putative glycosyltransferase [Acidimicrobiaceae bacterium]